ncbi:chain length determinant protein EpsF [Uliginosibacterium sp. sgz301328]|uniref:chain length determinant protein EpsF n=1 Tax=Uliginosibacterium sp. sgz301328 TaxID=3243764 RepID=UPI00359E3DD1
MSLQQLFRILAARRGVVFGATIIVTLIVCAVTLMMTRQYTAATSVVVDAKQDPIVGALMPTQAQASYMATQVDIISSERVALRAVKNLRLADDARFQRAWQKSTEGEGDINVWIAQLLLQRLVVAPGRNSNVLTVAVTWNDPKMAATLANGVAQAYLDTAIDLKVEPARQYAGWFEDRTRVLRANLESAQKKLSDVQRAKGIVGSNDQYDIENARLSELSSQLVAVQALRADSQSRQAQASGNRDTLPEVLQNPLISGLKGDLSRAEARRDDLATRLGPNHPEMQRVEGEIASLRARISQETNKIATSLGTANQVNLSREAEVRGALEAQRQRVLSLKQQRDDIAVLQRDVDAAQKAYDLVTQRLAQTNLESQTQQTNAVILTAATVPLRPSSPRFLLNGIVGIALGGFLGIALAILLELTNRRVRSDDDLLDVLNVPVLANVGAAPTNRRQWLLTHSHA